MVKVLSVITWLSVVRPSVPKIRFLCLIKAARANNVDTIAAGSAAGGVMGDIAK